jgi:hypothetical protein
MPDDTMDPIRAKVLADLNLPAEATDAEVAQALDASKAAHAADLASAQRGAAAAPAWPPAEQAAHVGPESQSGVSDQIKVYRDPSGVQVLVGPGETPPAGFIGPITSATP